MGHGVYRFFGSMGGLSNFSYCIVETIPIKGTLLHFRMIVAKMEAIAAE
jgi:hypothetical protein